MNVGVTTSRLIRNIPHIVKREPCFSLVEIMMTYHCTQRCLQCVIPLKGEEVPAMPFEDFKKVVDRLDAIGTHAIILSGGEPLLHPRFIECINYVAGKRFSYIHVLSTLYASQAKVQKLVQALLQHKVSLTCSFDGFGALADHLRGGRDVARVTMENMEYLDRENRNAGRPVKTGVNIVLSQMNLHQVPDILSYVERLGWLASLDVYRYTSDNQREDNSLKIEDIDAVRKIINRAIASPMVITPAWLLEGHLSNLEGKAPKYCPYLLSPSYGSRFFIHPNGDVKVCLGHRVGNLLVQTPQAILDSPEWSGARRSFESCTGCWTTCHTPLAKFSNYTLSESLRSFHVLKNFDRMKGVA
ncbi:MAG: radical SAM protein [Ignavibacteriales bacterium]|nr:radical SAM protein [Ignavibacteriales bacterium]